MRRALAALAVASLFGFGAIGAGGGAASLARPPAHAFAEAAAAAHVAVVAVPAPHAATPPLVGFTVFVSGAAIGAAMLGYVTRQRRRARFVPVLAFTVRRRGPPARAAHVPPAP